MNNSWAKLIFIFCFVGAFAAIISIPIREYKVQSLPPAAKPQCPANDVVIYPRIEDVEEVRIVCPVLGQQIEVVRMPNYRTYVKCSCPK